MNSTLITTYNCPQRAGTANGKKDFQRLADRGATVIGGQEVPDDLVATFQPKGWRRHRPGKAKSEVIYWDPKPWKFVRKGQFRLHSKNWNTPRFIVWVLLEDRKTGERRRFGVLHLVAFKTSKRSHAIEYEHQVKRVADWMGRGEKRVVVGDWNGSPEGSWLAPVKKVARFHSPETRSGPGGSWIDLIAVSKPMEKAKKAKALAGFHSDHKPVEATLPL